MCGTANTAPLVSSLYHTFFLMSSAKVPLTYFKRTFIVRFIFFPVDKKLIYFLRFRSTDILPKYPQKLKVLKMYEIV